MIKPFSALVMVAGVTPERVALQDQANQKILCVRLLYLALA